MSAHLYERRLTLLPLLLITTLTLGDSPPANAAQLDSIQLLATNPSATAKWYASNFGGKRSDASVKFGNATIAWNKVPESGVTANPAIAHIGFAVEGVERKLAALRKANVEIIKDVHEGPQSRWAIVADPDGRAVGIIEYEGAVPGLHHLMLNAPLRERRSTLGWYQKVVGGEVANLRNSPLWTGILTNNIWLLFSDDMPRADTKTDYTNASITWRVDDIAQAKELYAKRSQSEEDLGEGIAIVDPCGLIERFIEDPNAARNPPSQGLLAAAAGPAASGRIDVSDEQLNRIFAEEGEFVIEVIRVLGQDDCTLGQFFVNGIAFGYVLELPWQGNKPTISAIPPGTYKISLHYDSKKRLRLHVEDVPGRSGIQIHVGTTPEDTQGCVLLGCGVSAVSCTLTDTRAAFARLRHAHYGTENPESLKLDDARPAILIISDSVTSSTAAAPGAK